MKTNIIVIVLLLCNLNTLHSQQSLLIKDNRQLFLDHYLIDKLSNTQIKLNHPVDEGPVLFFDKKWEGPFSGYTTILKDGSVYKAYYRGLRNNDRDNRSIESTCIALSTDGVHWTKPEMNLYEFEGSKNNNIVLLENNMDRVNHNFSPFIDKNPNCKPEQRYKAVGGTGNRENKGLDAALFVYISEDGYSWKRLHPTPVITEGKFDSQNVAFWSESENQYVCYFRTMRDGFRSVSRTTSSDFINWESPVEMEFGETPLDHLYTQQTSPYYRAPQIYVAIGGRFMPGTQVLTKEQAEALNVDLRYYQDSSDAFIMTSRGGSSYDRTFMESYIRPEIGLQNWTGKSNYPALNVVQTSDTEMSLYVNKENTQTTNHLRRYSMRIDGFASLSAGYLGGEMISKSFIFVGKELEINYSTSAAGSIKIEIQDEQGKPISGYTLEDSQEIIGNEIKRVVAWKRGSDVSELIDKPIRLRIYLKDADLYSVKFNN